MLVVAKVFRHAAELVDAALERNALQIAFQIVRPLVVRAHELGIVAAAMPAEFGAAMRAAILEHMDRTVLSARHHNGRRSQV
jgi:hypothetical protein